MLHLQNKEALMKHLPLLSLTLLPALLSALTITEVVQNTIQTHPQIQIQKEALYSQKESVIQTKSAYLPSVDLSFSVGPEITKTPANQREKTDFTRNEASATLTQNIFAGLDTMYGMKEQESLVISAQGNVNVSANKLALEATAAYIAVLKTAELHNITKENVEVHDKYLQQIKEKLDVGIVRESDYVQTLSRFENAKTSQYLAEQNYLIAVYGLERILPNIDISKLVDPTIGILPANDIDSLVEIALNNNPTLAVAKSDIEAAKSTLNRSDAAYYPTADVVLSANKADHVHGLGYQGAESKDDAYSGLLVINYNVFNGLADSANKQISQHLLFQKNSALADAQLYIKANTKIAWATYEMTLKQLKYIQRNLEASAKTVSDYQQENELGRRSIIDLLNIELEHNNAKNRKANTKYSNLSAYYEILSYTGKMLEVMNVIVE